MKRVVSAKYENFMDYNLDRFGNSRITIGNIDYILDYIYESDTYQLIKDTGNEKDIVLEGTYEQCRDYLVDLYNDYYNNTPTGKYVENFWVGDIEYTIRYLNGTFQVVEDDGNLFSVVFEGSYEKCKNFLKDLYSDYTVRQFF